MHSLARIAAWLLAAATLCAAFATFGFSLNHPINADLAMLHYSAWLINERDFVVYRDIFELNFPAPFLFHSLLGHLIGYQALPLRFVDLVLLVTLFASSWNILAPLSRAAAVFAPSLFTLLYLLKGGEYVLERDVLALVPAVAAFALALQPASRPIAVGALAALACSFKPNAIVAAPLLWWLSCHHSPGPLAGRSLRFLLAAIITAAIPFIWMIRQGGFDAFIAIYRDFVPIYTNSRYDLWHYDSDAERLSTLLQQYARFGGGAMLLSLPGLLWAQWLYRHGAAQQWRLRQIAWMTLAFTFYEVIAGKFWFNHLFPSAFWVSLCIGLLLCTPSATAPRWRPVAGLLLLMPVAALAWLLGHTSSVQMHEAWQREHQSPEHWRARQVAQALQESGLTEDDRVQVLDTAGDGQAALLLAGATTATRHLIDVPLYMEPESAATRALRAELINSLIVHPPRFLVFFEEFLHPGGGNRLKEFKELYKILQLDYEVIEQVDGEYILFRRKP